MEVTWRIQSIAGDLAVQSQSCTAAIVTLDVWAGELSLRYNGHFPGKPGLAGVY